MSASELPLWRAEVKSQVLRMLLTHMQTHKHTQAEEELYRRGERARVMEKLGMCEGDRGGMD